MAGRRRADNRHQGAPRDLNPIFDPAPSPFSDPVSVVKYHTLQYGGERMASAACTAHRVSPGGTEGEIYLNSQLENPDGTLILLSVNELHSQQRRRDPRWALGARNN